MKLHDPEPSEPQVVPLPERVPQTRPGRVRPPFRSFPRISTPPSGAHPFGAQPASRAPSQANS